MLKDAKTLHDEGWAIHWLMPKSKRPLLKNWTTGPRHDWEFLKRTYAPGYNMGVRLGKASALPGGFFLGVIDCDVKSTDPNDLTAMETHLDKLISARGVTVISGRGNGSKHIYVKSNQPLKPRRVSQSPHKVKVKMPSSPASKADLATLGEADVKAGYRMRAAWEISIMGEGQQVVLPPSIHPDSGKPYVWEWVNGKKEIPIFEDTGASDAQILKKEKLQDWTPVEVDLINSSLSDDIYEQITQGTGVEDRSAALFGVSIAMNRAGFNTQEILSILTDQNYFLGEVAYDHAKTTSRRRAAEWVMNFTVKKAESKADATDDFEMVDADAEAVEVSSDVREINESLLEVDDWRTLIERNKQDGRPLNNLKNLLLIFDNLAEGEPFVAKDEFSVENQWIKEMPWGVTIGNPIDEDDCRRIKEFLTRQYRMEPAVEKILEALLIRADKSRFHPVREFVLGLEWDGVERAETWLKTYLGAEGPDEYLRAVGLKTLVAMIARVFEPGCKHDHVLILEGNQGAGKSTTARILSAPWFSDSYLNVNDKDSVMNMHGVWVNELGELSAMNRSEVNTLKEFVSRQVDKIRPPYGRLSVKYPRQNIFIGTTNNRDYLKDKTGNRRFWPVKIKKLKWKMLKADRDQLLAEAYAWWKMGEPLYLDTKEQDRLARIEQDLRLEHDELQDALADFLNDPRSIIGKEFSFFELLENGPAALGGLRNDRATQMRIGNILRSLGYDNEVQWVNGKCTRKWRKKSDEN